MWLYNLSMKVELITEAKTKQDEDVLSWRLFIEMSGLELGARSSAVHRRAILDAAKELHLRP